MSFIEVIFNFQLFRHGHRAPFSMYPKDPIPENYWIEGLGALTKVEILNI